jgi:ABC-type cobalamin/Fe3+-siderophores transport system ATPase subunit
MPATIENISGYTLRGLDRINILLGKNGCGKSRMLRALETEFSRNTREYGSILYVTPTILTYLTDKFGIFQFNMKVDKTSWLGS